MAAELETERLKLRPWTIDDVEGAFEIYSDPQVVRYLHREPEPNLDSQRKSLAAVIERYKNLSPPGEFLAVMEKSGDEIIGTIIFKQLPGWEHFEVGWHFARKAWGKGYATEAAKAMIEYAFQTWNLTQIVAVIHPENEASMKVARRLGMTCEGQIRAYDLDVEFFTLNKPE